MKQLYFIVIVLLYSVSVSSQSNWQEHLSHEYLTFGGLGHLFIDGEMTIANSRSAVKITGNQKPELALDYPAFSYQVRTTRTGINSKELKFLEAFDYDIPGLGFTSLRNNNGSFWGKEQFGHEEFNTDFQSIPDGILSPSGQIYDQAIDHNGDLNFLINGEVVQLSPSPVDNFHEGLNDNFFIVRNDSLFSYTNENSSFVLFLPFGFTNSYRKSNLNNDPHRNSLVVKGGSTYTWYDFDNFDEVYSINIDEDIIDEMQFEDFGFYTLIETDEEYQVLKYDISGPGSPETFYTLPKNEIDGFRISTFEVSNEDIYFVGNRQNDIGITYHYVQKRTIGQAFEPNRQDLAIDTFSVKQIGEIGTFNTHAYSITVRNNGTEAINSFAYSSRILPIFSPYFSYIRQHFDTPLEPGESFSFTDTINIFLDISQLEVHVTGVNYGLDANPENDSYIADVSSLSNKNLTTQTIGIYPNPVSEVLHIKSKISAHALIQIINLDGQIMDYKSIGNNALDISNLPSGIYYLSIKTDIQNSVTPFIKN